MSETRFKFFGCGFSVRFEFFFELLQFQSVGFEDQLLGGEIEVFDFNFHQILIQSSPTGFFGVLTPIFFTSATILIAV